MDKDQAAVLRKYGEDILSSPGMERSKALMQHGGVSVYAHSVAVAAMCLSIAERLRIPADRETLVRGALLHDYFLYDWHVPDKSHKWHGFRHPRFALQNAERDFTLNEVERNMIRSHMFPLTLCMPRYKESWILFTADKLCAVRETLTSRRS